MNSFYMHPKYQEFLGSIKNLESDARVLRNSLNLAFDVWLLGGNMSESKEQWLIAENERLTKQVRAACVICTESVRGNRLLVSALHWLHKSKF